MLFDAVIKEAMETIVKKIREGKKLSDSEVLLLVVSQMRKEQELIVKMLEEFKKDVNRRFNEVDRRFSEMDKKIDDFKSYVEKRFESIENDIREFKSYVEKRFDQIDKRFESIEDEIKFLRQELMSIKSDIINLLKEKI